MEGMTTVELVLLKMIRREEPRDTVTRVSIEA